MTHRQLHCFTAVLGMLWFQGGCSSSSKPSNTDTPPTTPSGGTDSGTGSDGATTETGPTSGVDSGGSDGASQTDATGPVPVGTQCTPTLEDEATYMGAGVDEIGVEQNVASCNGGVCLVNHFQGLTTCPYGQLADGGAVPGASSACTVPGTQTAVQSAIAPWCSNRPASDVICSCRCEDIDGGTDDSGAFCACPSGYACTQLVSAIGPGPASPTTGGYCIKAGTAYDRDAGCSECDPTRNPCP